MINRLHESQDHKDRGFTLVELLVVIVIIGILAGIAIPIFLNQRQMAVDAGIKSDLKSIATLQETYHVDHGTYADDPGALDKFTESKGNVITLTSDSEGYCIKGTNPGADTDWYYDSDGGGLLPSGGTC